MIILWKGTDVSIINTNIVSFKMKYWRSVVREGGSARVNWRHNTARVTGGIISLAQSRANTN